MGKAENLTNQKFGRLLVLERDYEMQKIAKRVCWKCECDCGNFISVRAVDLKSGHTKSCGCYKKEQCRNIGEKYGKINGKELGEKYGKINGQKNLKDLTGKNFGKLTVIERDLNKDGTFWICRCSCGKTTSVASSHLLSGHTKSCGCLVKEKISFAVQAAKEANTCKLVPHTKFGMLEVLQLDKQKSGIGNGSYYICKCECGTIISIKTSSLISGHTESCGCLKSKGEYKISQLLNKLKIKYDIQKTFPNCNSESGNLLKFDFYLPDYNILIEYQGKQHYQNIEYFGGQAGFEKRKFNDNQKVEYCKNNNLKLLLIPYTDYHLLNEEYILSHIKNV